MNHTSRHALSSLIIICALASSPIAFAAHHGDAASMEAEFKAMDANNDSKVSPAEHATGAQKMFVAMDANKDSTVTAAEMDAAHKNVTTKKDEMPPMSSAEKIKMCDTNGDGSLTTAEHTAGAVAMFAKMDSNKDGFVSQAECTAGHAAMMPKAGT